MKLSLISMLAVAGSFIGVMAAPQPEAAAINLEKRASPDYVGLVNGVATDIAPLLTQMVSQSKNSDKKVALSEVKVTVQQISTKITAAAKQVGPLSRGSSASLSKRQVPTDPNALAAAIVALLVGISAALDAVIVQLGLTTLIGVLGPLLISLSGLLLSLEVVVNNLLALVQSLVDALLTGLSLALAGLVL